MDTQDTETNDNGRTTKGIKVRKERHIPSADLRASQGQKTRRSIPSDVDAASRTIIGAAIEVHRHLGPGLLESIYEQALVHELSLQGIGVRRQVVVPVQYKELRIEGQRLDLLVAPGVIVEVKAVETLLPIHEAQLLSYHKSTGLRLGLLMNFHAELLREGIRRMVN